MNSAGRLYSKSDLEKDRGKSSVSVTEATALDMLGRIGKSIVLFFKSWFMVNI
jgi:hypothetical protein